MTKEEFLDEVVSLAIELDNVLDGNSVLVCVGALCRLLGMSLSLDVMGQVEGINTKEDAIRLVVGGIEAAYEDGETMKKETMQ